MNPLHLVPSAMLAFAFTCGSLAAQIPVKPPPWWRVNDDVTVSLFFEFNPGALGVPTIAVVPPWYNPVVTQIIPSPNLQILSVLTTHTNVLALVGNGTPQTASLEVTVDNDPHVDWIKIFWFQYDEFHGTSGSVAQTIAKDLAKYGRATVTEESRDPIGGGWETVTISAKLIPQPDDEKLEWSFLESAFGTEAIDNLFINSKCVKPGDDEKGEALGDDDGFATLVPGGHRCRGVGVTEGPGAAFVRTYWLSTEATTAGANHLLLQMNSSGALIATTPLPATLGTAPLGAQDIAVETVPISPGVIQQFVYVLVDERPTPNGVRLHRVDTSGILLAPTTLVGFPPIPFQRFGLAFDPSGNLGAGTFWVTDQNGIAYEFSRAGVLLETRTIAVSVPGAGFSGLGYDATFGNFYGFSPNPRPSPFGPLQVNGFEWSGYDFQATGAEFLGNLNTAGTAPKGGTATGFEVYRRRANGDFRMACVANDPSNNSFLYELKGPYRFGWSQMGTCGMQGGPPFEGGTSFAVTLRGLPNSVAAFLYAGLSNTTSTFGPLPAALAPLGPGWEESHLSISLDVGLGAHTPSSPGKCVAPVLLPPAGGLSYVPIFFQWIVLDTTVPGLLAMSQAGKTIAY